MKEKLTLALVACSACRLHFDEVATGDAGPRTDAPSPDATTMLVTFGERPTSQHVNVTTDTFLDESTPTANFGADESTSVAGTSGIRNHTLIRFELSALSPTTVVVSATLELDRIDFGDDIPGTLSVVTLAQPWTEGTGLGGNGAASWMNRVTNQVWTTPGGTAGAMLSGPEMPTPAWQLVLDRATVQTWVADPSTNAGVMIVEAVAGTDTHYHFHSRESQSAALRPQLTIELVQ